MLLLFVFQFFVNVINMITFVVPTVTTLPFGIDSALVTVSQEIHAFLEVFWPLSIVWTMFLWYVFAVLPGLLFVKLILGGRTPSHI